MEHLMRNPFDDDDDITKPEIANYVFYGKKTKFEKQQCSYSDLRPHILNQKMKDVIEESSNLRKKVKNFHSLLNVINSDFLPVLKHLMCYGDFGYSFIDDESHNFLIKLFRKEISFKEILKEFKKNNDIINLLLKNHVIFKEIVQNLGANKTIEKYFQDNGINDQSIAVFMRAKDYLDSEYDVPRYSSKDEMFFEDIRMLLNLEYVCFLSRGLARNIPRELHQTAKKFLKLMCSLISGTTKDIVDFENITSNRYGYDQLTPLPEDKIQFRTKCVVFKNIDFDSGINLNDIITNILRSQLMTNGFIGFQHCKFNKGIVIDAINAQKCNLYYDDCLFNCSFRVKDCGTDTLLRFNHCSFYNKIIFGQDSKKEWLPCNIEIRNSIFVAGSTLEITNITKCNNDGYNSKVALINTIINGYLKLANLTKEADTLFSIRNVAITMPYTIENCFFNRDTVITGLSFAINPKEAMLNSKNSFVKSLKNSGLNKLIINNGLLDNEADKSAKTETDKDIQSYKIACESGFLKPKYAAYYLGMSKDNLAKKRMADKQRITRESIPYVGKGKSILYPVDALDAFKIQDWELLKELREKYAQNNSFEDDE